MNYEPRLLDSSNHLWLLGRLLHGITQVQTLYEEQEGLLNAHMNAIQVSFQLLSVFDHNAMRVHV